ncbi:MAG: polyprenyl synthetase family protein [Deltaproteobacteria bacterium]|nr:polyprenyl synthetase family protein [Deltaproteobacteria bacterium]
MRIQEAYGLIKEDLKGVEQEFKRNLDSQVYLIRKLGEYILNSGGKRFRPTLVLLSAKLCNYQGNRHTPLASIIEFIHTATLLHDDVVDNARMRRGRESTNAVWGNGASVLVGDFLFSKSFYLMVEDGDMRVLQLLSRTTTRMAEGEVLQLLKSSDPETTEEEYINVITSKTAVLISAACQIGAILGKVSKEKEKALAGFGMDMGIAFQLVDDCLDYISRDEELGKVIGNDLKEGKVTLPLIHTLGKSSPEEREKIIEAIEADDLDDPQLKYVMGLLNNYKSIGYTLSRARRHIEGAKSYLEVFGPSPERSALVALADYVVERSY